MFPVLHGLYDGLFRINKGFFSELQLADTWQVTLVKIHVETGDFRVSACVGASC